jgi:hypothetical protein
MIEIYFNALPVPLLLSQLRGTKSMGAPTEQVTGKKIPQNADILDYPAVVETLARQRKLPEVKVRAIVRGLVALVGDGLKMAKRRTSAGWAYCACANQKRRSPVGHRK